jgi:hypothetical protein
MEYWITKTIDFHWEGILDRFIVDGQREMPQDIHGMSFLY